MAKRVIEDERLMPEWDWEKNNEFGLDPNVLMCESDKRAWWKCENGHSWFSRIDHRARGSKCPYCTQQKPIEGVSDLPAKCEESVHFWDKEKNVGLSPHMFFPNSKKYGRRWEVYEIESFTKGDTSSDSYISHAWVPIVEKEDA